MKVMTVKKFRGRCQSAPGPLKEMIDYYNKCRVDPPSCMDFIKTEYKDKTVNGVHSEWRLRFNEATPAVFDEAIEYLRTKTPVAAASLNLGLSMAAYYHSKWMVESNNGQLSHTGPGGNSPSQRVSVYGTGSAAENILYTGVTSNTPTHFWNQFHIDDGVSSRGHRTNLFAANTKAIGVGIYRKPSNNYPYVTMVFVASEYACTKCDTITCDEKKALGWDVYLRDSGLSDPACTVVTPGGTNTPNPLTTPDNPNTGTWILFSRK